MTCIAKRVASIIVAFCILGSSIPVRAETIELDAGTANKMVREIEACRERSKQLDALKQVGVLKDQRIDNLKLQLAVTSSIARDEKEYANLLQDRLKDSTSFWKEPVLWFALGVLITSVGVGVAVGVSR